MLGRKILDVCEHHCVQKMTITVKQCTEAGKIIHRNAVIDTRNNDIKEEKKLCHFHANRLHFYKLLYIKNIIKFSYIKFKFIAV